MGLSIQKDISAFDLLRRPEINYKDLKKCQDLSCVVEDPRVMEQIDVQAKYDGYLKRQEQEILERQKYDTMMIPDDFSYEGISGLSNEVVEKLKQIQPKTLGQASRISGITPASITILLVYLKRFEKVN